MKSSHDIRAGMEHVGLLAVIGVLLLSGARGQTTKSGGQAQLTIKGESRTETVDGVWRMASRGELLTPEGWRRACAFFTQPTQFPQDNLIRVVSNDWGPAHDNPLGGTDGNYVGVGYVDMGTIDAHLRYKPPPRTDAIKTGYLHHLVAVPAYTTMYGPDGKTVVEKKPAGYLVWQIEGPPGLPWTTVNSAIRYVLEMRLKSGDPVIQKNADASIRELLKLH